MSFGRVERGRETCPISHLGSRTNQINTKEEEGRKRSTKEVVTFWSEEDIKMLHTTDLFLLRLLMRRWDASLLSLTLAKILNLSIDPPLQKLSLCMISVCRWDAFSKGIRTQFPNLMSYLYESTAKYGISRVPLQRQLIPCRMSDRAPHLLSLYQRWLLQVHLVRYILIPPNYSTPINTYDSKITQSLLMKTEVSACIAIMV